MKSNFMVSGTMVQTSSRLELGLKLNKYFITLFLVFQLKPKENRRNIKIASIAYNCHESM